MASDRGSLQRFLSILSYLLILQLPEYISMASAKGHCVWYGVCSDHYFRKTNCFYNGTALPIEEEGRSVIAEYCPDIAKGGLSCCDHEQLKNLGQMLRTVKTLLAQSPPCLNNFLKYFCGMTCGVNQSEFLYPEVVEPYNSTHRKITEIEYHLSLNYMETTFDTCKKVKVPPSNQSAMDFMCGEYGEEYCTPSRWFQTMGDATSPFVPFQINHRNDADPARGLTPYDPSTSVGAPIRTYFWLLLICSGSLWFL